MEISYRKNILWRIKDLYLKDFFCSKNAKYSYEKVCFSYEIDVGIKIKNVLDIANYRDSLGRYENQIRVSESIDYIFYEI